MALKSHGDLGAGLSRATCGLFVNQQSMHGKPVEEVTPRKGWSSSYWQLFPFAMLFTFDKNKEGNKTL